MNPPPAIIQKLGYDFDDYGFEIMDYAISKSALKNNNSYSFIDWLLKDWNKRKLKSIQAIKQYEDSKQTKASFNKPTAINNYPKDERLSLNVLEMKKSMHGINSFTDEEMTAYENYY